MDKNLKHILCIDDQEDILEVTVACLETVGGYQVTSCRNGKEGYERAAAILPDLILVDVMMPSLDGPATLSLIRSNSALDNIPVIFMTARIQPQQIEEYKAMGALGVIAKPYDPITLSQEVQNIWDQRK